MSAPLYETRPPLIDPGAPVPSPGAPTSGISVSSRLVHLDPGWFSLSVMPGPADVGSGLPAVRVSFPPGLPGRRETITISTARGDGWMTANDEPTILRVAAGGGDILATLYWTSADASATAPALRLMRLNPEAPATAPQPGSMPASLAGGLAPAPSVAEIVAHIEGVGDVDGRFGDWIGMRGSGRAIEGFSLTPRQGFTADDFELRAVLGRDWLSPWLPGTRYLGSRGLALPLRGFCLRLRPMAAVRVDVACFARFVDGSETGPVGSDQICAASSLAALEAFRVLPRSRMP